MIVGRMIDFLGELIAVIVYREERSAFSKCSSLTHLGIPESWAMFAIKTFNDIWFSRKKIWNNNVKLQHPIETVNEVFRS